MPPALDDPLLQLFVRRPDLAPALLERLGFKLPRHTVVRAAQPDSDAPWSAPTGVHVVLQLKWAPVLGIVTDVPRSISDELRSRWALQLQGLQQREQCAVELLLVTPRQDVSLWAGQPLQLPGRLLTPHVVYVPPILSDGGARPDPMLALLCALAHAQDPNESRAVRMAQLAQQAIFNALPDDEAAWYVELIRESLPESRREQLIAPIPCPFEHESSCEYFALGVAGALLDRLEQRHGPLPPGVTEHILTRTLEQLAHLRYQLATSQSLEEALGVPPETLAVKHGAAAHLIEELARARHDGWKTRRRWWPWSRSA
jgi:hypothetical protein